MHCLTRTIRKRHRQLRHHFTLGDYCSSVHSAASNSAAPLSPSVSPFVGLICTQSPLISTYSHSKANSYHYFCRRSGVCDIDSGPGFSISPLSTAAETEASRDADITNNDERQDPRAGPTGSSGKRVFPEDLTSSVVKLTCKSTAPDCHGVCDVYLVGTVHVSSESCKLVKAVIGALRPQVAFLELCSSRKNVLQARKLKVPTTEDMLNMWKKNRNLFMILYSLFLAEVGSELKVVPGAEFRVAYKEAMKYGGKVIFGDRPVQITLLRTWRKMPLWHKIKLLWLFFPSFSSLNPKDLHKMLKDLEDGNDMLTQSIQKMSKRFPTVVETFVDERDRYMSSKLLKVASEHSSVVAVVGKGHLPGIKKYWNQPVEIEELLITPTKRSVFSVRKIFTMVGVVVGGISIWTLFSCTK